MKQNKENLKQFFETGDKPTQQQYADLIDSYIDAKQPEGEANRRFVIDELGEVSVASEQQVSEYTLSPISGTNTVDLLKDGVSVSQIDLTPYLDNTNLARLVSGTVDTNGLATFTRDDNSTFTVDLSNLKDTAPQYQAGTNISIDTTDVQNPIIKTSDAFINQVQNIETSLGNKLDVNGNGSQLTNVDAMTIGGKAVTDLMDLNTFQIVTDAKAFIVGDNGSAIDILNEKNEDAIYITNKSIGDGIRVINEANGVGFISNGVGTSTGYLYTGENDGTTVYSVDKLGNIDTEGEVYSKGIVVDPLGTTSGIAGSNFTVKKKSTSTSTNASQFIDVDRQASSAPSNTSSNTYGLVSRVVNNSTVEDAGFTGSNLVGRSSSSSNFNFVYGTINSAEALGSGNGNFVASTVNRSKVTGAATIDYMRGTSSTTTIDNESATVNYMQGHHNSLVFTNGSVGQASVMYLDIDGGSATVTGDLAYIRAGNDALPTVNGNSYFIKSESTLPSEFAGSISTSKLTSTSINTTPVTFTSLPASPSIGDIATITDAGSVAYRGVASGGGSNIALVMYDGTNWIYH